MLLLDHVSITVRDLARPRPLYGAMVPRLASHSNGSSSTTARALARALALIKWFRLHPIVAGLALLCCAPQSHADDGLAEILASDTAFIERVDGQPAPSKFHNEDIELIPGPHKLRIRRRLEAEGSSRHRPPGYPRMLGTGGRKAVFVTDSMCTLSFTARGGARYTARVEGGEDANAWTARVHGPDVDVSCTAVTLVPVDLIGESRHLCCTMAFHKHKATDANYRYTGDDVRVLPAGTPVRIDDASGNRVTFTTAGDDATYKVYFEYGIDNAEQNAYFHDLFPADDPTVPLRAANPALAAAIASGELTRGMTRAETIAVRGYPPRHRTPDLGEPVWIFYRSPGRGDYVTFVDGVIGGIHTMDAP